MSGSRLKKDSLEIEEEIEYSDLQPRKILERYSKLKEENQFLKDESRLLKEIVLNETKKNHQGRIKGSTEYQPYKNMKIKKSSYVQIILAIGIIVLSLGFHILYMSVADCLLFKDGDPACFYKSWMGTEIHASLYLDLMLYSIIISVSILILLIMRNLFNEKSQEM
ncbi:MAG: hypothetical protein ACW98D_03080 [Promethearchaeota archaeon]|jgi:hypothetical protein